MPNAFETYFEMRTASTQKTERPTHTHTRDARDDAEQRAQRRDLPREARGALLVLPRRRAHLLGTLEKIREALFENV